MRNGPKSARPPRHMKPSGIPWLGDIPEDWGICRVGYLMNEINRRSVDGEEEPLSMSQKLGIVPSREIEVANPASSYVGAKIVEPGDLVLNKLKAHLGVFAISKYNGVVSPDYSVYRVNEGVSAKYLNYLFHTPVCISEFRRRITGVAVGFNRLYTSEFFKIQIPLPSLTEQRAIAERINGEVARIDALCEKVKREIDRLGDYKKSLIAETVSKGLHKRKLKPSGIPWLGNVPAGWEIVRCKYVFSYYKNLVGEAHSSYDRLALTMQGVVKRSKTDSQGLQPENFASYQILHENDFVFKLIDLQNISTSRVGLSPYVGIVSPAYIILHATGIHVRFAHYYFMMMWLSQIFNQLGNGGVRNSITSQELLNQPILLPPIADQREIAEYLDRAVSRIDAVGARRKTQLEKLESFKRSMIQEYTTGKKEAK